MTQRPLTWFNSFEELVELEVMDEEIFLVLHVARI